MFYQPATPHEAEAARLEGEMAEVCGLLNATTAKLVGLIGEVLATGSWTGWGIRSPEHWVAWQCGVSAARAHKLVGMARRLPDLPAAREAFTTGEVSEDQVAVLVRHIPDHNDAEVTELARYATVSQLQRTLRSYPFTGPDQSDPEVEERREVSFGSTDSGRWRLWADLPADEGAMVERALISHRDWLFRQAEDGQAVGWADALLAMAGPADRAAAGGRAHRDRAVLLVHLDTQPARAAGPERPVGHVHNGPALPDSLRRYLSCDSHIRPVWERHGVPVSVGRTLRTVPERTRIVVEERDRGCRTPGCTRTRWLHVHHVVHWEDGGPTDTANLVCLCSHHHRLHHRGRLGIRGNADRPDGLCFTDQRDRPLTPNAPPTPPGDPPDQTARRLGIHPGTYHHPTGEPLDPWSIQFSEPPHPPDPPEAR